MDNPAASPAGGRARVRWFARDLSPPRPHLLVADERGCERVAAWRRAGEVPELHESPQHRTWRVARTYAAENIDRLRAEVSSDLERAAALLGRGRRARSDAFFELKEHLSRRLWRLGSATHCLYEWEEPDDSMADIDDRENPGDEQLRADAPSRLHRLRNGRRTRHVGLARRRGGPTRQ